jgi:cytochrome P450
VRFRLLARELAVPEPLLFDPFSVVSSADPWALYRRLRSEAPAYYSEAHEIWVLSRFDDVQAAARDWRTFSSEPSVDLDGTGGTFGNASIIDLDPPRHDELRSILNKSFSLRATADLATAVRRSALSLLGPLIGSGVVEYVGAFAWRLPVAVAAALLGVPTEDEAELGSLLRAVVTRSPGAREIPDSAFDAASRLRGFLRHGYDTWATGESELATVLTTLREAAQANAVTVDDAVGLLAMLGIAFTETTSGLLTSLCRLFAEHPDQVDRLRISPDAVSGAVEEVLRFEPPAHYLARRASVPVQLHDQVIPAGSRVLLLFASANRDERRWNRAEELDLFRPIQRHVGFGEGIHHCLGAPLARLEAQITAELLLRLTRAIEIAEPERRWYPTHGTRGSLTLGVRLEPSTS